MALVDFAPHRPVPSTFHRIVRGFAGWVAESRARRAKVEALQSILFQPEHRLRDLGLRREDVLDAMERHRQ